MTPTLSIILGSFLWVGIFVFTVREVLLYRQDQRTRSDIYPYPISRLRRRLWISVCLITEVALLFFVPVLWPARVTLSFMPYLATVLGLAAFMVFLAWRDLRESVQLANQGKEQLLKEFLQEIQQAGKPNQTH